jgi:uncharacterized protein (DUF2267 family)
MANDLLNQLAAALADLSDKKAKKSKSTPKFVLVVDGKVSQQRPTNKAEVEKAVHAILMVKPTSKIELYKFKAELKIALPISGLDGEAEEASNETTVTGE